MINIYIKELETKEEIIKFYKVPKWLKKIILKIIIKTNYIIEKQIDENKKIYLVPNIEKEKVYRKIKRKLEKEKIKTQKVQVILSNKVKKYEKYFKNYLIADGKNTFLNSIEEILNKISQKKPLALQDIYILTNQYCEKSNSIIKKLASKVKTINIITNQVQKYKNLEEIMQEQGIILCVANNKKKSLKKAKIIVNLDFTNEEIKQYNIFRNAIFINTTKEKITNLRGFEGIIIQNIEIKLEENQISFIQKNYLNKAFSTIELYETLEKNKKEKGVIISNLYGNNGKIDEKELGNIQKILTN